MTAAAILIYIVALTLANLSVAAFGPVVTPINAFVLIGLDLALRNWLAMRVSRGSMLAVIAGAGAASYLLNPASGQIAVASVVAFTASALVDWLTFSTIRGQWLRKSFGGVAAGALVDSLVFPTLAFGALLPGIVAAQFVAKVAGGWLWSLVIASLNKTEGATP
jgi:uncharacterized PurR-regulated membrane protein YhhQ (DUF165 family)